MIGARRGGGRVGSRGGGSMNKKFHVVGGGGGGESSFPYGGIFYVGSLFSPRGGDHFFRVRGGGGVGLLFCMGGGWVKYWVCPP